MSYNDAWELHPNGPSPFTADGVDNGWSGTLSAFDIAALQERYGANNSYATGNDVYQLQDANEQGAYYQTIWDTGGTDVICYDGSRNARIDLLAATIDYSPTGGGVISFVDDIWGGFTIARGVAIENAAGGEGDDDLLGNAAVNVLSGNGGADVLVGRCGGDVLNGGDGFDVVSYIDADAGVRASLVAANRGYTGDAAGDIFVDVEALQGSAFADILSGGNRDDMLDGLAGDDSLSGGNGEDVLLGGAGNSADILAGEGGNDTLDGGNSGDELGGGAGDDTLDGGNGNDILLGGDGIDNLDGGNGNDDLDGGAGNDVMTGGNGNDTFVGGTGDDTMSGGNGGDTFVFIAADGLDTIGDFRRGQDLVDLTGADLVWADLDSDGNGVLFRRGRFRKRQRRAHRARPRRCRGRVGWPAHAHVQRGHQPRRARLPVWRRLVPGIDVA